jgi:hypothetical protein
MAVAEDKHRLSIGPHDETDDAVSVCCVALEDTMAYEGDLVDRIVMPDLAAAGMRHLLLRYMVYYLGDLERKIFLLQHTDRNAPRTDEIQLLELRVLLGQGRDYHQNLNGKMKQETAQHR